MPRRCLLVRTRGRFRGPRSPQRVAFLVKSPCQSRTAPCKTAMPALPMTTNAPAICGAPVLEYSPCSPLIVSTSQTFAPVFASSANRWAFVEATYTLPFQTATPRLTTSQHAARPIAALFSGSKTQICLPVVASSAYTTPRLPDVYMTPSTTSGVAAIPREVLVLYSHANPSPATLPALIRCNGE